MATPAMSSRLPRIMGATSTVTSPSSAVARPRRSQAAASTASGVARFTRTRPRSVLCAMRSPHSFATTGKPNSHAASTACCGVVTTRSPAMGTPTSAKICFDIDSDSVTVPTGMESSVMRERLRSRDGAPPGRGRAGCRYGPSPVRDSTGRRRQGQR